MENKFEKEKQREREGQIIAKKTEEKIEQPHAIETYTVGLPGQEVKVADSITGDQLEVAKIEAGQMITLKRDLLEREEGKVIESKSSIEDKSAKASQAIELTKEEAEDIQELSALFDDFSDRILMVKSISIENPSIPEKGMHFMITKPDAESVKNKLVSLGYKIEQITGIGFTAKKKLSELSFVFAKEKKKE